MLPQALLSPAPQAEKGSSLLDFLDQGLAIPETRARSLLCIYSRHNAPKLASKVCVSFRAELLIRSKFRS
jgi:hypothetical protein